MKKIEATPFLHLAPNRFALPVLYPQKLASGRVQILCVAYSQQCWNLTGKIREYISINEKQQGSLLEGWGLHIILILMYFVPIRGCLSSNFLPLLTHT